MFFTKDDFDTKLLGKDSFKLIINESTDRDYKAVLLSLKSIKSAALVCCSIPFGHSFVPRLLAEGFELISTRNNYGAKLSSIAEMPASAHAPEITIAGNINTLGNIKDFEILIKNLSKHSRYCKDRAITNTVAEKVYDAWFYNSLYNGYADKIIIAQLNATNVGFLSLKIAESIATIDLIVVDPGYQGLGVGGKMLTQAKNYLEPRGVDLIKVETEAENIHANRFYQKNKFLTESFSLLLHKHLI